MDEHSAKKLGEVLAFAEIGLDTLGKGKEGFAKIFTGEQLQAILQKNEEHVSAVKASAKNLEVENIVLTKAQATGNKLTTMRDLYIGDSWDDPIELMEWSGFFEGAALVHWSLVHGKAKKLQLNELEALSEEAMTFHEGLLKQMTLLISQHVSSE